MFSKAEPIGLPEPRIGTEPAIDADLLEMTQPKLPTPVGNRG